MFRRASNPPRIRRQPSLTTSLPPPVGGWNARDSIANMEPRDAVTMINWFPETNDVRLRKGQTSHMTGFGAPVESLMSYNATDGTKTLFAASGTSFFDATTAGAVGAAVQTGLTNSRWQSINFTISDGTSYLNCFNGVDAPRYWDGSAWTTITDVSTPAITNVTTTKLISATVHKRRMWLVETGTLKAWYLPVDSVGGAAANIDLAGIASQGGFLMAIGTWTLDGGEGVDDYWVGVTSQGEVIVYRGTDPTSAATWTLQGVWNLGEPIGRRCLIKYRGDLLIVCVDGVFPLAKALQSAQTNPRAAITDLISKAMTDAAVSHAGNFGWQLLFYPKGNMLLLNVPIAEGSKQEQYTMNTITERWGQFKGIAANCWTIHNEEPFFGASNIVGQFWNGLDDLGNNIDGDMKQAFNYFGSRGLQKKFNMMRPILLSNGAPSILAGVNIDYEDRELTSSLTFSPLTDGVWDTGVWDTALWGGGLSRSLNWQSITGVGTCAAVRLVSATQGIELRLEATDFIFEKGGVLG